MSADRENENITFGEAAERVFNLSAALRCVREAAQRLEDDVQGEVAQRLHTVQRAIGTCLAEADRLAGDCLEASV